MGINVNWRKRFSSVQRLLVLFVYYFTRSVFHIVGLIIIIVHSFSYSLIYGFRYVLAFRFEKKDVFYVCVAFSSKFGFSYSQAQFYRAVVPAIFLLCRIVLPVNFFVIVSFWSSWNTWSFVISIRRSHQSFSSLKKVGRMRWAAPTRSRLYMVLLFCLYLAFSIPFSWEMSVSVVFSIFFKNSIKYFGCIFRLTWLLLGA